MFKTLLGLEESQQIAGFDLHFTGGWILALVLFAVAVAIVILLYHNESRLTQNRRIFMGICKGAALFILILMILNPVAGVHTTQDYRRTLLVLVDSSRSMAIEDQRTSEADVANAAHALGKLSLDQQLKGSALETTRKEIGQSSRFDLAKATLTNSEIDLFNTLNEHVNVRFFSFDKRVKSQGGTKNPLGWLDKLEAVGGSSRVGSAMDEAAARFAGQPIAGMVVLSDFAWADGRDPVQVARRFGKQGLPVFPVSLGLPKPPDVHVRRIIGPEVVFKGDKVPLRVQIESNGYKDEFVNVALKVDGQESTRERIKLTDGLQFTELTFIPKRNSGTIKLDVVAEAMPNETSDKNNIASHKVSIIDEKIKVLYIEGMPRWEYRYLRRVLLRDTRLDVRFLMTQGDPKLAAASPRHLARFPQVAKDAFKFDLIILGDVPSSYFTKTQMELIKNLIKKHAGSLLMVAGPVGAPMSYRGTPIEKLLPVKLGNGQFIPTKAPPVVTDEGRESDITTLAPTREANKRVWAKVRPMYLPPLTGPKSGAKVLLAKPKAAAQLEDYPIIAWQKIGTGKCMFVATEDLWRMRLEAGDKYHARFWGQAIQFLTLARLLGKNKQTTVETDLRTYSAGDQVRVFANVLTQSFDPVIQPSFTVVVSKKDQADTATEIELSPVADSPGLYTGAYIAGEDGDYQLKPLDYDPETANVSEFEIVTIPMEDRETSARRDVAQQIAEQSGGKMLRIADLAQLAERFQEEVPMQRRSRIQMDLWDAPIWFVLLGFFAGVEWFMRRRNNLV